MAAESLLAVAEESASATAVTKFDVESDLLLSLSSSRILELWRVQNVRRYNYKKGIFEIIIQTQELTKFHTYFSSIGSVMRETSIAVTKEITNRIQPKCK